MWMPGTRRRAPGSKVRPAKMWIHVPVPYLVIRIRILDTSTHQPAFGSQELKICQNVFLLQRIQEFFGSFVSEDCSHCRIKLKRSLNEKYWSFV